MKKLKLEEDDDDDENQNEIKKLKRSNKKKNIVIILLFILLIINILLQIPIIRRKTRTLSRMIKSEILYGDQYNSKYKLDLKSEFGDVEAYHPKIIQFENKWNGYYYWLTYTPYPDSDEQKENPYVVASNDLINWETPQGLKNPIDDVPGDEHEKYNSDSHLVYNDNLDRLECYWRYVNDIDNTVTIYRRNTTNGIDWTEKEVVAFSDNRKEKDFVAPAIIYEDGKYKIWYVGKNLVITYAEAEVNDKNWKDVKTINLEYPKKLKPWHLDIIKTDEGYEMLLMAFENWGKRGIASLYHTVSKDNNTWEKCTEIIKPSSKSNHWDNRGIYRSSMIKKDGIYYVFYSASNKKNIKGIGIMYGKDINNLQKVDINYTKDQNAVKKFQELIEKEKNR